MGSMTREVLTQATAGAAAMTEALQTLGALQAGEGDQSK